MTATQIRKAPGPTARARARKRRRDADMAQRVRWVVQARDGVCRLAGEVEVLGACSGVPEFAHLSPRKRFQTRGQAPEARHQTAFAICACTGHHDAYDGRSYPRITITPCTDRGADGALTVTCGGRVVVL